MATRFKQLHKPGQPVVLANAFDAHSAEIVAASALSKAIATASYAVAATHGLDDDALDLDTNIAVLRRIRPVAEKYGKPVTVDLQDGYGARLEEAIAAVVREGASGCNLEDRDNESGKLFPFDEAVDRVKRALAAAKQAGVADFVINARTDAVLVHGDLEEAIRRGKAFLAAGATTVFVWGGPKRGLSRDEVARLVGEFDGRLNVIKKFTPDGLSVQELADIGVARISVGPALWRKAMTAYKEEAEKLLASQA
ncbi:putative carboxyphosphonoenolpyruvate mutase [Ramicandelaber brevisporus]|nr:putative carboxyphosphonoenolpyruvate mutase [Ramicandelaber brevisporus]